MYIDDEFEPGSEPDKVFMIVYDSSGPVTINGRVYDESDFQRTAAEAADEPSAEQVARLVARQASGENRRGRPALQGGSVPARTRIGRDLDRRLEERAALDGDKKAAAMRDPIDRGWASERRLSTSNSPVSPAATIGPR